MSPEADRLSWPGWWTSKQRGLQLQESHRPSPKQQVVGLDGPCLLLPARQKGWRQASRAWHHPLPSPCRGSCSGCQRRWLMGRQVTRQAAGEDGSQQLDREARRQCGHQALTCPCLGRRAWDLCPSLGGSSPWGLSPGWKRPSRLASLCLVFLSSETGLCGGRLGPHGYGRCTYFGRVFIGTPGSRILGSSLAVLAQPVTSLLGCRHQDDL